MNRVELLGRLTSDPEIRTTSGENASKVASYTLAVDRRFKKEGGDNTDFIRCKCFGKGAEFAEKYLKKGTKIAVCGRIQTGSYTNKEGNKVYTTDVIVDEHDFAESSRTASTAPTPQAPQAPQIPVPGQQMPPQQPYPNPYPQQPVQQQYAAPPQGYYYSPQQQPVQPQPQQQYQNIPGINIPVGVDEETPFN